ncbi:MAG TPA: DNA translocase FtsK 4TM domain-containing protein [Candidatus Limnocylindria bacterium]|nr:DNA translocase FtsK 4TM domain-containing protein [Candidatus Limnocylindria bacterium]
MPSSNSSISAKRQQQILALLLGAFSILAMASVASYRAPLPYAPPWSAPNACGPVGSALAFGLVWAVGRLASFGAPILAGAWAWNRLRGQPVPPMVVRSAIGGLLVFELCTLLALAGLDRWSWAGSWGFAAALALRSAMGDVGSWIVAGVLFAITLLVASELGFHWLGQLIRGATVVPARAMAGALTRGRAALAAKPQPTPKRAGVRVPGVEPETRPRIMRPAPSPSAPAATTVLAATGATLEDQLSLALPGERKTEPKSRPKPAPKLRHAESENGMSLVPPPAEALPALSLLALPVQQEDLITASDLTAEANLLVAKLADFGIVGRVTEIHPGPVVTTFEFEPAAGVKVNQIVSREDDLALALRAQRIRILAPIPGKGAVGVEIPNRRRRTVYLREVLASSPYEASDAALKVALGVDVVGQPFVADLTRMPHLLVAGATGSGKSVCLNAIITGLLFQHDPKTLQLVMIDPKMLELSAYNGIPHLVMPVVTEAKRASRALRWGVSEMEKRYKLMATCGARNIAVYNEKVAAGQVPTGPMLPSGESPAAPEQLSYVVVVIDELADLMLTAPAEIEEPIARLAQMARAVGIHLVLATQRPSVDVITGVIKANFPSRIAFQVASKTDSRTVLDMNGAENLLGHGDMLFTPAGRPEPYRIHGAYISEEETARVVDFWRAKASVATFVPPLATDARLPEHDEEEGVENGDSDEDELIREAARLVVAHQQGSTSLLQRRLKVGYSRAGRLMDQLENLGVVGPFQGSKAREVLVDEHWLQERGLE